MAEALGRGIGRAIGTAIGGLIVGATGGEASSQEDEVERDPPPDYDGRPVYLRAWAEYQGGHPSVPKVERSPGSHVWLRDDALEYRSKRGALLLAIPHKDIRAAWATQGTRRLLGIRWNDPWRVTVECSTGGVHTIVTFEILAFRGHKRKAYALAEAVNALRTQVLPPTGEAAPAQAAASSVAASLGQVGDTESRAQNYDALMWDGPPEPIEQDGGGTHG